MSYCTFTGNSCLYGHGAIYVESRGSIALDHCIISYSEHGPALECSQVSSATLTCCDLYGNAGGDWTGCITD